MIIFYGNPDCYRDYLTKTIKNKQMKASNKIFLCVSFTIGLFSSCTKELNLEPISSISAVSFWKTENDALAGANAMYVPLRTQNTNQGLQYNTYFLGEARSEIMTFGLAGSTGYNLYYENSLTPTAAGPSWIGYYAIINAANLVLKYVPEISFQSENTQKNILAEAYAMRAYTYFIMVRTWGDLVIRTEPMQQYDPADVQKERSPKEEIFKLIKEDIDKAIQLFPNNNFPTGRFKWSKPAVNALKAEVYLWTGKLLNGGAADFNIALTALNEVQTADVSLLPNFADIFSYTNKGNKEVIMAIRLDVAENVTGYTNYMYGYPIPSCTPQADKDLIGVQGANANHAWQLSPAVRNAFTDDDQRKRATFIDLYKYNAACVKTDFLCALTTKFKGTVVSGIRVFVDDIILYRYADILLMKAEALNALGQDPSMEINMVRQRAYGINFPTHTFVSGTKEENDAAILKERLLELAVEGKRWWDLVRFDKAFELVPSLQARSSQRHLLLFPISNTVLSLEPKVVQNPGYK